MSSDYAQKAAHIAPAFLTIAVLSTAIPLLLLTVDRQFLDTVSLSDAVYAWALPMGIAALGVWLWLAKRVRVLVFQRGKTDAAGDDDYVDDDHSFMFLMMAWVVIFIPATLAVIVIPRAMEPLSVVATVAEVDPINPDRYYELEEVRPDLGIGGAVDDFKPAGSRNQYLSIGFYFVVPLVVSGQADPTTHPYWLGFEFKRQISRGLPEEEIEVIVERFYEQSHEAVASFDYEAVRFLEVVQESVELENYRLAAEGAGLPFELPLVVLVPGEGGYAARTQPELQLLAWTVALGWPLFFAVLAFPRLDARKLARQQAGLPDKEREPWTESFLAMLLLPRPDNWAVPSLMLAMVGVYAVMVFSGVDWLSPAGGDLLAWGGNRRAETLGGEWWRLLASVFVHGGAEHLLLNVVGLFVAALFVETIFGKWLFLAMFLLSGISGSALSVIWNDNAIAVGASGAIFGLFGALMALSLKRIVSWRDFGGIYIYVAINLVAGLSPGIDNAAHLGGLACGLVMGLAYRLPPEMLDALSEDGPDGEAETDDG